MQQGLEAPRRQLRSTTLPSVLQRQVSLRPPVEATRVAGLYALPMAAPDMVGDRPPVEVEDQTDGIGSCCRVQAPVLFTSGPITRSGVARWVQLALVIAFLCVDSSRYILDVWALRSNEHRIVLAQTLVLLQAIFSFASALTVSGLLEGITGVKAAFLPKEVLRCLPISVGFALAQASFAHAFSRGLGAASAVALGFLYMPLCALISRWMFSRAYGWLETHALVLLTLSILSFAELRSRAISLNEDMNGAYFVLIAVLLSCLSSLLAEWVLKPKYNPNDKQSFYLQKVRLEVWGVLTSLLVLWLIVGEQIKCTSAGWDHKLTIALVVRVVHSWMAGLLAKHLSTVAKAVIQCLSLIIVFFFGDLVVFSVGIGNVQISILAVVVALSALMYQMGRQRTIQTMRTAEPQAVNLVGSRGRSMGAGTGGVCSGPCASTPWLCV